MVRGLAAVRVMALVGVVVLAVGLHQPAAWGSVKVRAAAVARAATPQTRILYASDWEGPTEARFMDSGLVYADGARIDLIPYSGLGG